MRIFSWLTVLIAALTPTVVVALIVLRADPGDQAVQRIAEVLRGDWLLVGLLAVAVAPWPALGIAMVERDRRRYSRVSSGNGAGSSIDQGERMTT